MANNLIILAEESCAHSANEGILWVNMNKKLATGKVLAKKKDTKYLFVIRFRCDFCSSVV